jgi:hypothetical protein
MKFTVRPLTPDLLPALEDLFNTQGPVSRCWCMYWRIGDGYRKRPPKANKAAFFDLVKNGPPPGLLAFDGDLAVGWCQLTPRAALAGSRLAPQACRRRAGLVTLLLLHPQGLSQTRCYVRVDRSSVGGRKACGGPSARSLSA